VPLYLVDSSIWIGRRRSGAGYLDELLTERFEDGLIATCVPVALEVLVGPPDGAAYDLDWEMVWSQLEWLPLTSAAAERALAVQRELAHQIAGAHRRPPIDFLVAACAEAAGPDVVLWHWDSDLTVVCEHTGQPHEAEHARARTHGAGSAD
jgi:predicted nucleic acid-binding protein